MLRRNPDSIRKVRQAYLREDMYLRFVGSGEQIRHEKVAYSTERVEWVSEEGDEKGNPVACRTPKPYTILYSNGKKFIFAGKHTLPQEPP